MRKIKDIIFNKFSDIKTPNDIVIEEADKAIKKTLGLNIPNNYYKIIFNKPCLTIKAYNATLRSEIFLNKEKIIREIKTKIRKNTHIKVILK